MSMVTVDELPEFCYMLRHRTALTPKRTEVAVNTPLNRKAPKLNCGESAGAGKTSEPVEVMTEGTRDTLT
jgi:hypothetical protein